MTDIEDFIYNHEGVQREIMLFIHEILIDFPEITSKLSYKLPFYYRKSWICYLNPLKNGKVELAFPRGNELSNAQNLLVSKNRKQVKGIELESVKDIPRNVLLEIIQEAVILDETIPYSFKNNKK